MESASEVINREQSAEEKYHELLRNRTGARALLANASERLIRGGIRTGGTNTCVVGANSYNNL